MHGISTSVDGTTHTGGHGERQQPLPARPRLAVAAHTAHGARPAPARLVRLLRCPSPRRPLKALKTRIQRRDHAVDGDDAVVRVWGVALAWYVCVCGGRLIGVVVVVVVSGGNTCHKVQ